MTEEGSVIRVLLVEDHALMRRGIKGQFALIKRFEIVGEAADGAQAVEMGTQYEPDIVLMDIDLPVLDGIGATQQIKSARPQVRVLALTAFDEDTQVVGMLAAGADGYCLKSVEWDQLMAVIDLLMGGGAYLDPQVAQKVARLLKPGAQAAAPSAPVGAAHSSFQGPALSSREREILKLIAEGESNQEIADKLYLSLGTVKSYVRMVLNKLSVDDRVQAAAKAVREGLI